MSSTRSVLRLIRRPLGLIGLVIVALFLLIAIAGPLFMPYEPQETNLSDSVQAPSSEHRLGTDELGRDVLSEMVHGARTTLLIAASTVLASITLGTLLGAAAGYIGGTFDGVASRLIDGFLVIPQELLAIVVVAMLGPSRQNIILALTLVFWPTTARLMRGEFIGLRNRQFVEAAQISGLGRMQIIFGEILPSAMPIIVVNATFLASETILAEAGLSFLGLNDPNISSWGKMVFDSMGVLRFAWWTAFFPGLAIVLLVLGLNLTGDTANEVINPRTSQLYPSKRVPRTRRRVGRTRETALPGSDPTTDL